MTTRSYSGGSFLGSHAVTEGLCTKRQLTSSLFRRVLHDVYVEAGGARVLLPLVDWRAMSPPETKVRVACRLGGLPHPVPQFGVFHDGVFLGQVGPARPEARPIVE